jgi:two-component system response regulator RegA
MKRALVVDDDPRVLALIKRWLASAGFDTLTSTDFEDARIQLHLCEPAILVSDVRLGQFNGLHLGILARQARPDVRLVFISGWDDPVLRRDAAELGAMYLQKPVQVAELLSAVQGQDGTASAPLAVTRHG